MNNIFILLVYGRQLIFINNCYTYLSNVLLSKSWLLINDILLFYTNKFLILGKPLISNILVELSLIKSLVYRKKSIKFKRRKRYNKFYGYKNIVNYLTINRYFILYG